MRAAIAIKAIFPAFLCCQCASFPTSTDLTSESRCDLEVESSAQQTIRAIYIPGYHGSLLYLPACDRYLSPIRPAPESNSYAAFAARIPVYLFEPDKQFELEISGYVVPPDLELRAIPGFRMDTVTVFKELVFANWGDWER